MKKTILLFLLLTVLSCNNKRDNLQLMNELNISIDKALESRDIEYIKQTLIDVENVEKLYPDYQNLKKRKYALQIRLKDYSKANETIDSIIKIDEDNIDDRIVKGILLEIIGNYSESINTYNKCLELIDIKIAEMLKGDRDKYFIRRLNRIMILKLLNRDLLEDYNLLRTELESENKESLLKILQILEEGSRTNIIDNYR